jgi:hypothetical protein
MGDVITYVGIDAHKKDLPVAMLVGHATTSVTWTVAHEPTRDGAKLLESGVASPRSPKIVGSRLATCSWP